MDVDIKDRNKKQLQEFCLLKIFFSVPVLLQIIIRCIFLKKDCNFLLILLNTSEIINFSYDNTSIFALNVYEHL